MDAACQRWNIFSHWGSLLDYITHKSVCLSSNHHAYVLMTFVGVSQLQCSTSLLLQQWRPMPSLGQPTWWCRTPCHLLTTTTMSQLWASSACNTMAVSTAGPMACASTRWWHWHRITFSWTKMARRWTRQRQVSRHLWRILSTSGIKSRKNLWERNCWKRSGACPSYPFTACTDGLTWLLLWKIGLKKLSFIPKIQFSFLYFTFMLICSG